MARFGLRLPHRVKRPSSCVFYSWTLVILATTVTMGWHAIHNRRGQESEREREAKTEQWIPDADGHGNTATTITQSKNTTTREWKQAAYRERVGDIVQGGWAVVIFSSLLCVRRPGGNRK